MSDLQTDLAGPGIELVETHTAWVFLGEATVWKVKKPVDFGFLDFRTLAARRAACDAELRLNARLAPGVYEAVVPITVDERGRHRIDGDGKIVDWAVRMARLPDAARGDVLLREGRLTVRALERLAEHLALFHARADTGADISAFGTRAAILTNVKENFAQTRGSVDTHVSAREAAEIEKRQIAFVDEHEALFARRIREGRIRDGHGDLRLEHAYFVGEGAPLVIDCIEFNDRFRYADVCADVSFLSMDLERLGRSDLAERFLGAYARASGDYDLYEIVDFYEAYRAYVRGKVSAMLASDVAADLATREEARKNARQAFLLALLEGREALLSPALVAVGGVIASGKSTLAERAAELMAAPIVDSDRTRKRLLGVAPTQRVHDDAWTGAYAKDATERAYAELFRNAASILASGRPVVLDATFRSRAHRERAREVAREHGAAFQFVECRASAEECRQRLARRAAGPSVSDGRLDIFADFVGRWEPTDELSDGELLVVDSSGPPEVSALALEQRLPAWPAGFHG